MLQRLLSVRGNRSFSSKGGLIRIISRKGARFRRIDYFRTSLLCALAGKFLPKTSNVFHFLHAWDFDLFEAPAIFHRRGGVDAQTGGDASFGAGRVERRAGDAGNDDRILVRLDRKSVV